ncbi:unnamed protein product [Prunus armeniaca]|uniref:Uncharacterized protein n=1 Tax=Prunus armeniaca TaxID=36596 RepID=A0A6J5XEZ1_PRUAR|nr:unnamed protein product [Prunus armeniaca]
MASLVTDVIYDVDDKLSFSLQFYHLQVLALFHFLNANGPSVSSKLGYWGFPTPYMAGGPGQFIPIDTQISVHVFPKFRPVSVFCQS